MKPYCPHCFGEFPKVDLLRCPLDKHLLVLRCCPGCSAEASPRDRFCGDCSLSLAGAEERLLLPPTCSLGRQKLSFCLDIFAVVLVALLHFSEQSGLGALALGLAAGLLYRGWARSGSGQSFGQAVVGALTVGNAGEPLALGGGLRRTLWELALLPLLWRSSGPERLERHSGAFEVRVG